MGEPCASHQGLSLFYWGQVYEGSTTMARMEALRELGCHVTVGSSIEWYRKAGRISFHLARRLGIGPLVAAENRALLQAVDRPYDVIWLDKASFIRPETLVALRRYAPRLVHFTPDPMFLEHRSTPLFRKGIAHFDIHATTKPEEMVEYENFGARKVILCQKSYDPSVHRAYPREELEAFRSDVAFIGAWSTYKEAQVARVLHALPEAHLRVWGPRWEERARDPVLKSRLRPIPGFLYQMEYGRALAAARVGLGLLAWDYAPSETITDRALEIPACGSMLLAPRTESIASIFKDGEEALLFDSPEEMVDRLRWALDHEVERATIAERGKAKVAAGPFRNRDVVQKVLEAVLT